MMRRAVQWVTVVVVLGTGAFLLAGLHTGPQATAQAGEVEFQLKTVQVVTEMVLEEDIVDRGQPRQAGEMLMRHAFQPGTLVVSKGFANKVILRIHNTDADTEHGGHDVDIPALGIGSAGAPIIDAEGNQIGTVGEDGLFYQGQEIKLEIDLTGVDPGVYEIFCTIHDAAYDENGEPKGGPMVAYLVVLP